MRTSRLPELVGDVRTSMSRQPTRKESRRLHRSVKSRRYRHPEFPKEASVAAFNTRYKPRFSPISSRIQVSVPVPDVEDLFPVASMAVMPLFLLILAGSILGGVGALLGFVVWVLLAVVYVGVARLDTAPGRWVTTSMPAGLTRAQRRTWRRQGFAIEKTLVGARVDLAWLTATRRGLELSLAADGCEADADEVGETLRELDDKIAVATSAYRYAAARKKERIGVGAARARELMGGTPAGVAAMEQRLRLQRDLRAHLRKDLGLRAEALDADSWERRDPEKMMDVIRNYDAEVERRGYEPRSRHEELTRRLRAAGYY